MTRVFIVAGGPSLKGFDYERLRGHTTIAINRAFEVMPFATFVWWTDGRFWHKRKRELLVHGGELHAAKDEVYRIRYPEDRVRVWRLVGLTGLSIEPGCLCHGNNGGYAAINLASQFGFDELILLGYDMKFGPQGESHWHDGYELQNREKTLTKQMLPHFKTLVEPLKARGIKVINANLDSALDCWLKVPLDELL